MFHRFCIRSQAALGTFITLFDLVSRPRVDVLRSGTCVNDNIKIFIFWLLLQSLVSLIASLRGSDKLFLLER